jgi:hypothetical protein
MKIHSSEVESSGLSLVDECGKLLFWNNRVLRAIKHEFVGNAKDMLSNGMFSELVENNLFPRTWVTDFAMDGYGLILEHERIVPVLYPYEWSFSMIKDAAISVLKVNQIAIKYGYQTKDCHPFNILFDDLTPKYVDFGSFVKVNKNMSGWMAYKQFLESFYFPLKIWSKGNSFLARSMIANASEHLPLSEYILYKSSVAKRLNYSVIKMMSALYFNYKNLSMYSSEQISELRPDIIGSVISRLREHRLLPFVSVNLSPLIKRVENINKKESPSTWGRYHHAFHDDDGEIRSTPRFDRIIEIVDAYHIDTAVELGGNQGVFSKLLKMKTKIKRMICIDIDENAIDALYISAKEQKVTITPALLNCIFPITFINCKDPWERTRSDVVIALALTHHLLLGLGLGIDFMLETIGKYTNKYILIEFMPLGLWDGAKAPPIPHWYNIEWFRNSFMQRFNLISEEQLDKNRILFFGELTTKL